MPRLFYKFRCRLASLFRRNGKNDELSREIEQHIELSIADLVSKGTDPEEARKATLREFGNVELMKPSLYPALHRLENEGFIKSEWKTGDTDKPMKVYCLTPAGKKQMAEEVSHWELVTKAVNVVIKNT